ncbi:hypothetical protein [Mycoplasma nasistruthionis]|uniref:Uncharacterized protein n=1 Tax=Mycoplasma nasistruthionis TaxID=353852 RepID=A0A5B7XUM6_9MOLU|nr:hypothetical protein [Mycoplasma nasistruthionis]QCZ36579.1 hypothetical protein FG904_00915 [Mycoplasma nasistruthionis]
MTVQDGILAALGLTTFIMFALYIIFNSSFINHSKLNLQTYSENDGFFTKVELDERMYKYFKFRFYLFLLFSVILILLFWTTTGYAAYYIYHIFTLPAQTTASGANESGVLNKLPAAGVSLVVASICLYLTYVVANLILRDTFPFYKLMQQWAINDLEEPISYFDFLKSKVSKKDFPKKVDLSLKNIIKNKNTTLSFRQTAFNKLFTKLNKVSLKQNTLNRFLSQYYLGKGLFNTLFYYEKTTFNDVNIEDTELIAKLIKLLEQHI